MPTKSNTPHILAGLPALSLRFLAPLRLGQILSVARQRKQLAELDDRMLRDVGLTKSDVQREVERPVWDVPAIWRD
ncbi:MAG: DUF1127 domain-containing protein [Pseudomonadota bacterium]